MAASAVASFVKNRVQTLSTDDVNSSFAVRYEMRLGYTESGSALSNATSSIVFADTIGANAYGMQMQNYNSNTASFNYLSKIGASALKTLNMITISDVDTIPLATFNAFNMNAVNMSTATLTTSSFTAQKLSTIGLDFNNAMGVVANISTGNISTMNATNIAFNGAVIVDAFPQHDAVNFLDNTGSNAISMLASTGQGYMNSKIAFVNPITADAVVGVEYLSNASGKQIYNYATQLSSINGRILFDNNMTGPSLSTINISTANLRANQTFISTMNCDAGYVKDLTCDNFTTTSDARAKTNIVPIEAAMEKINQLEPVYYDWIDRPNLRPGHQEIGFIAQAVNEVLPNIVGIRDDGRMAVGYDRLTAVLAGAVKELNSRMKRIEEKVFA